MYICIGKALKQKMDAAVSENIEDRDRIILPGEEQTISNLPPLSINTLDDVLRDILGIIVYLHVFLPMDIIFSLC